jgi:hypothetical protein
MGSSAGTDVSRWRISARAARVSKIFASIVVAGFLMAVAATNSAVAATALFVGGIVEPMLYEPMMGQALGGMFTGTDPASKTPWVRQSVYWPAQMAPFLGFTSLGGSVSQGKDNLVADIAAAQKTGNGPVTVVGASAGSLVLDETLRYYQEHPDLAPDPKKVNFVIIADGSRQDAFRPSSLFDTMSGYTYQSPAQTAYNVSVVTFQYDGFADFPDQPLNLLAVANAVAGMLVLHNATYFADISKMTPTSVVTDPGTGGTTTRYLIAPLQLPLVTLMPFLAPIQDQLKQIIDTGYSRNATVAAPAPAALTNSTPSPTPSPVVAQPAKTSLTEALPTLQAPPASVADVPADAQTQTNQTPAVVPETAKQPVAQVADLPAKVSSPTTGDTAAAPAASSEPEAPTANPVPDAVKTTATNTTTANTNTATNTNTNTETKRPQRSAKHERRASADAADSSGDSATANSGTADSDTAPKRPTTAKGDGPNPHTAAESKHGDRSSATESDHEE